MESSNVVSPSVTVIRVRRKRTAEPLPGLIVSHKRTRSDSSSYDENRATENLFYRLAEGNVNLEKVVEVQVDYGEEKNASTDKQAAIFDENYRKLLDAVKSVKMMKISETAGTSGKIELSSNGSVAKDVEMDILNKAPLAEPEDDSEYVYDFYTTNQDHALINALDIRLPTDDELKLYFGFEDGDSNGEDPDDDSDSNAENYHLNDYPDERQFVGENETTDSDDNYDHYNDKYEEFEDYCYDSSSD